MIPDTSKGSTSKRNYPNFTKENQMISYDYRTEIPIKFLI